MSSIDPDFVLIGFIEDQDEVGDNIYKSKSIWRENFIGGEPVFSPNMPEDEIKTRFSPEMLTCDGCGDLFAFMVQMNCPVDEKLVDRVIYIFSCVNPSCSNRKWKVLRVVSPSSKSKDCVDMSGEPSGMESMEHDGADLALRLEPEVSVKVHKFKAMYLTAEEGELLVTDTTSANIKKNVKTKGVIVEQPKINNEVYEKFLIPGTDQVANKFIKTVSKFSRQVIRYAWNGKPLLNQDVKVNPTKCTSCGGKRTFELQIMPGLICQMKPTVNESMVDLDFGTVLFFTCKNNCNQQFVHVEESIVLNDPDSNIMPSF